MKKLIVGVLAAMGLFVVLVGVGFWFTFLRELPALDATLSLSSEVALNSTVPMTVMVTNPHDESVTLDSIDIADTLLSGFRSSALIRNRPTLTMCR